MSVNVGTIDRVLRVVIGLALIAFAIPLGFPDTGWNWIGWIGVVPLSPPRREIARPIACWAFQPGEPAGSVGDCQRPNAALGRASQIIVRGRG